ncbi:MAG: imidazole glycerol phosphate synthase subunit HisH [Acidobacteriota bacterium]
MSQRVTVIDAGVGNLGNLVRALGRVGAEPTLTTDPEAVAAARCLVLPGVGAFRPPRERLRGGLEEAVSASLAEGGHLLGICVGYQLLFEGASEFGETDGLGLLPGRVDSLPNTVRLPQIGWNALRDMRPGHPLFAGLGELPYFYFVHTFAPLEVPADVLLASAEHGARFAAVAGRERVLGTQFHPEKSGPSGLRLLANYLEIARA